MEGYVRLRNAAGGLDAGLTGSYGAISAKADDEGPTIGFRGGDGVVPGNPGKVESGENRGQDKAAVRNMTFTTLIPASGFDNAGAFKKRFVRQLLSDVKSLWIAIRAGPSVSVADTAH